MTGGSDITQSAIYQPLQDRQIRILKILPGKRDEDIRCELELFELSRLIEGQVEDETRPQTFEAISYVWGDPNDRRDIVLNGIHTSVTRNLFDALFCFRQRSGVRYVWADALCINQMDLMERASQVLLMADVYQQCTKCLIWLGEDTVCTQPMADVSTAIIELRGSASAQASTLDTASRLLQAMHPMREKETQNDDALISSDAVQAVLEVCDKPWWKRVWTIQEVLLPYKTSKKVSMFLGSSEIDFDVFLDAAAGWWRFQRRIATVAKRTDNPWLVSAMDTAMTYPLALNELHLYMGRFTYRQEIGPGLHIDERPKAASAHLTMIAGHQCSDLRDMIYGLLGLFERTPLITSSPNYTESVYKCYCVATRGYMSMKPRLDYLTFAHSSRHPTEGLPSWVIAYHKKIDFVLDLYPGKHGWANDGSWRPQEESFYDTLSVETYAFSRVEKVLPMTRWEASRQGLLQMFKDWLHTVKDSADIILDFLHIIAIIGPSPRWSFSSIEIERDELQNSQCLSMFNLDFHNDTLKFDRGKIPRLQSREFYAGQLERDYEELRTSHLAFVTLTDGRMGMAYDHVEVGDIAALIKGAAMPALLRPVLEKQRLESGYLTSSKSHRFISSCFCNRPMDRKPNESPHDYNWWSATLNIDRSSWQYEVDWTDCDLV